MKEDMYPQPRIDETLDQLQGASNFSLRHNFGKFPSHMRARRKQPSYAKKAYSNTPQFFWAICCHQHVSKVGEHSPRKLQEAMCISIYSS